ncbi:efflux RND transporter periplasmic adaptor subunit [Phyllobacterium phragmitis]|uniref:Multidrug efflux RND transporter periplasmic adaptor subunit MexM n=1 Tax=Phyllobacterium phragmitis TaxID=2670329 RepID=A0ABQ0H738_9HYPH
MKEDSIETSDAAIAPKRMRIPWSFLLGAVVAAAVAGGVAYNASSKTQMAAAPPPATPVKIARAAVFDIPHVVEVVGTVDSLNDTLIRTQVEGVLTAVNFNEGDLVREGDLLAAIDDRPYRAALAAAQAQLARDRTALAVAERELARAQALLRQNVTSAQIVDQRSAEVEQLRATIALDEANVESAQVNLSFTKIYSPTTGRVGLREVDPGNLVRTGDVNGIASVVQMDPVSVVFSVPQQLLAELKNHVRSSNGGGVAIVDRGSDQRIQGRLAAFDNRIGDGTGTARVRAVFDNEDERLTPGAFVSLELQTSVSAQAIVIPKVAVRLGIDGSFVFRIRDGVAERVPVSIGYNDDDIAVVNDGIQAGDAVVTDGYSRLRPSARAEIVEEAPVENPTVMRVAGGAAR